MKLPYYALALVAYLGVVSLIGWVVGFNDHGDHRRHAKTGAIDSAGRR